MQRSNFQHLKEKWGTKQEELSQKLWSKHGEALEWITNASKKIATTASLGGILLLSQPTPQLLLPKPSSEQHYLPVDKSTFFISDLYSVLPHDGVRELTPEEEKKISEILSRNFGLSVSAELSGKRLNRSYGLIGAEQHLARYPGDTMGTHFDSAEEAETYYSSGMAPGLGAWGYFAKSRDNLGEQEKLREKYYIAVQTFLSPGFYEHVKDYVDFYKYRKMLVVNPQNGRAIVADIADAGPAEWTGKHLGGSPEVMKYLQRVDGAQRGPVLYFFIDDPGDKVPLGPIEI